MLTALSVSPDQPLRCLIGSNLPKKPVCQFRHPDGISCAKRCTGGNPWGEGRAGVCRESLQTTAQG